MHSGELISKLIGRRTASSSNFTRTSGPTADHSTTDTGRNYMYSGTFGIVDMFGTSVLSIVQRLSLLQKCIKAGSEQFVHCRAYESM